MWSDKPWEIFTLSQRKSRQPLGHREKGGAAWKTNEEEDRQILQRGNEKMRRSDGEIEEGKRGEKAEISSSGFSLKPLVKVNEGCAQSSETDYITAPFDQRSHTHTHPSRV